MGRVKKVVIVSTLTPGPSPASGRGEVNFGPFPASGRGEVNFDPFPASGRGRTSQAREGGKNLLSRNWERGGFLKLEGW
jgi:hypothetical protein